MPAPHRHTIDAPARRPAADVARLLHEAVRLHRSGRLGEAETLYDKVLRAEPGNARAWHFAGLAAFARGDPPLAASRIRHALALDPASAEARSDLANLLKAQGDRTAAVALHRDALCLDPGFAEAYNNLAATLSEVADPASAANAGRRALQLAPHYVQAHANTAAALRALARDEEALVHLRAAAALKPDLPGLCNDIGNALVDRDVLDQAAIWYRRAAAQAPGEVEAHANLGNSSHRRGDWAEAQSSYRQALMLAPAQPLVIHGLATLLIQRYGAGEAGRWLARAMVLRPDDPDIHLNLALVAEQQGLVDEADSAYRCALALDPAAADALRRRGVMLLHAERYAEAAEWLRRAMLVRPGDAAVLSDFGAAARAAGNADDALAALRDSLVREPGAAATLARLGTTFGNRSERDTCLRWYGRAVAVDPWRIDTHNSMGLSLFELEEPAAGLEAFRRVLIVRPDWTIGLGNLGVHLHQVGDLPASDRWFRRGLQVSPHHPKARWNYAWALLALGHLEEGWEAYEAGFGARARGPDRQLAAPRWQGEDIADKRLLIWREQGVGDLILFASCIPEAVARAGSCTIEVDDRVVSLFQRSFPEAVVRAQTMAPDGRETALPPDFDVHVPAGSLPRLLRPSLADFPDRRGFLKPDPALVRLWRDRLAGAGPGPKIGMCWRSGVMSRRRSKLYTRLIDWEPILYAPGIEFVSLQYGEAEDEIRDAERRFGVRIHRWPDLDLRDDFEQLSALIANLDCVVSAGTAVACLAGALGVPVWKYTLFDEWTGLGTGASPWFPSMRLFEKAYDAPWDDTLGRIASEVRAGVSASGAARAAAVIAAAGAEDSEDEALDRSAPVPSLSVAIQHHRAGERSAAAALYRRLLIRTPEHPNVLHLLGVLAHDTGDQAAAVTLIGRALRVTPDYPAARINLGNALRALRRREEAAACYRMALAGRPADGEALTNLGKIEEESGRPAAAVVLHRRALAVRPDYAEALANLGAALLVVGGVGDAVACLRRALTIGPALPEALRSLALVLVAADRPREAARWRARASSMEPGAGQPGRPAPPESDRVGATPAADTQALLAEAVVRHRSGDLERADALYRHLLAHDPANADLLHLSGVVRMQRGRLEEAIERIRAALILAPDFAQAENNLGLALQAAGACVDAARHHLRAVTLQPDYAEAYNNLGNAFQAQHQLAAAEICYGNALTLRPDYAEAHGNLGNVRERLGRPEEAVAAQRRALCLRPDFALAYSNLGKSLTALERLSLAERALGRALIIDPGHPEARANLGALRFRCGDVEEAERLLQPVPGRPDHPMARWNRSLIALRRGDFAGGWEAYDAGLEVGARGPARTWPMPRWQGEPLAGRRLLIWREQGVGDELMFASCYPEAIARAGHCVIECDARLLTLFRRSFPDATVRAETLTDDGSADDGGADWHVPAGSLPRHLRPDLASFPSRPGFLYADPERVAAWRDRVAALGSGRTLGICWRGRLAAPERSPLYTRLAEWGAVLAVAGVRFVNVQYGACAAEIDAVERQLGVRIHRWPDLDLADDFEEVAGLLSALDLVIAPGTAMANLAGALGVPVWQFTVENWTGLGTDRAPWFPSMRRFLGPPAEGWRPTLAEIARCLQEDEGATTGGCITDGQADAPYAVR